MAVSTPQGRLAEQRWYHVVLWVPYVLMALLVAATVAYRHGDPSAMAVDLALCAATTLWILSMVTLRPAWRRKPVPMAIFFVGVVLLTAALVLRDPWFGFFSPALYVFAFSLLPWPWEVCGVAAVAVVAATAQSTGIPRSTGWGAAAYLGIIAINVVPMCWLSWIGHREDVQSAEREAMLAALSEANQQLEATLAENAGLHERLLAQAREAGRIDERARMAREIHDTLAQGLTGIITQLQAAVQAAARGAAEPQAAAEREGAAAARGAVDQQAARRHVEAAIRLARESLSEARRSVHALRPVPLDGGEPGEALSGALADVAERWSALHGTSVRVVTTGTPRPMPPEAEVALLRTAQEALANVARHAEASRVGVTLSYLDTEVALDVRDDGRGFTPPTPQSQQYAQDGGFGLVAMRQRVEALAGTLQIESEPGGGTAISVSVPLGVPACLPVGVAGR